MCVAETQKTGDKIIVTVCKDLLISGFDMLDLRRGPGLQVVGIYTQSIRGPRNPQ